MMRGSIRSIAAVLTATVLVVLDASIVNVALPSLARALGVSPGSAILVTTAYQLALVTALLPCAALGESLGFRTVFTAGVALFAAASLLCAIAPSLPWLIAARFLQGLGGAAVMALGVALLRQVVAPGKLGAAIGWNALAVALASAAGPSLGAMILSGLGWKWLFAVNLPLGAITLLAAGALPRSTGTGRRLDWTSVILNAGVFAALVAGADLLPKAPGASMALFPIAGLALLILVRRELPKTSPLVPLDLLRVRGFRLSVIASVCCFAGQGMALLSLPFHLQHNLGLAPLAMGFFMTPWPLTVAVMSQAAGWLAERISTGFLCATGAGLMALGLAGVALVPVHAGPIILLPFIGLCGLGFGLFQTPNNRNLFLSAPLERSGAAGGLQGAARLTGQTAGAVLTTLLFSAAAIGNSPRLGLGVASLLVLAAGLASLQRASEQQESPRRKAVLTPT